MPKCVRIELEWDDGTVERAVGDEADEINRWHRRLFVTHWAKTGQQYDGPQMKVVCGPLPESLLALARAAVLAQEARRGEDVSAWADRLARDVGGAVD